jgi:hypothetical protein
VNIREGGHTARPMCQRAPVPRPCVTMRGYERRWNLTSYSSQVLGKNGTVLRAQAMCMGDRVGYDGVKGSGVMSETSETRSTRDQKERGVHENKCPKE